MNDKRAKDLRRRARWRAELGGLPTETCYVISQKTGTIFLGECLKGFYKFLKKGAR